MMMPTIPSDVIISIVDNLANSTNRWSLSLRSCSFVSPPFRDACQRHLYRSINLYTLETGRNEEFYDILVHNPRIGFFVRHLSMRLYGSSADKHFCDVLRMLPHIRTLSIVGVQSTRWGEIESDLKEQIEVVFQQVSLERVSIHRIDDFPLCWLISCSRWKELGLYCITVGDHSSPSPAPLASAQKNHLRSLKVEDSEIFLNHPSSCLMFSHLQKYQGLIWEDSDSVGFQALLDTTASFLEDIHISMYMYPSSLDCPPLDFSRLTSLQYLTILMEGDRETNGSWFSRICSALGTLPSTNNFKKIILEFSREPTSYTEGTEWRRLDEIVRGWEANRLLHFKVIFHQMPGGNIADFFTDWMPHLVSKGCIFIYEDTDLLFPEPAFGFVEE